MYFGSNQLTAETKLRQGKRYFWFCQINEATQQDPIQGGSPGLVVMGGDSCSKGHEFESWHRILDGHFSHLFVVKNVMCV